MKKFINILLCMLVIVSLTLPAFATETEPETATEPETETVTEPETEPETQTTTVETGESGQVVVNVNVPATTEETTADEPESEPDESAVVPYSMTSLDETGDETATDETEAVSLSAALESLFGKYEPRTQTVTEVLSDGSVIEYQEYVPGVAGMDWDWIATVGLFSMFLYCVLRMIGGCLKWN